MKVVALVGKPRTGKTTAAQDIAQHFHVEYVSVSPLLQEVTGISARGGLTEFVERRIREQGAHSVAKLVKSHLHPEGNYVLDRLIYSPAIQYWQQSVGVFILFMETSKELCLARILQRDGRIDSIKGNREEQRQQAERIWREDRTDGEAVRHLANYVIDTTRQRALDDKALLKRIIDYWREGL